MYVIQVNRKNLAVMKKMPLEQVLSSIRVCPVSIIPPYVHTHSHLHDTVKIMANGRSLGTFQKAMLFRQLGTIGWKSNFTYSLKYNSQQIYWYM
jgi:hypothetical protein